MRFKSLFRQIILSVSLTEIDIKNPRSNTSGIFIFMIFYICSVGFFFKSLSKTGNVEMMMITMIITSICSFKSIPCSKKTPYR